MDNKDKKYQQAMEEFERMRIRGEQQRIRDEEEVRRRREHIARFGTGGRNSYRSPEEQMDDLIDSLPGIVGAVFGLAVAYMLKAHEMGIYIMLASAGFYGGVFVKHNAFGGESAVSAFRSTMPALFIAMAGVIAGFISLFVAVDIF